MKTLQKYLARIAYLPNGAKFNFLAHIFMYVTFAFGFAYTFFGETDSVGASILYKTTSQDFGSLSLSVWGICAMLFSIGNLAVVVFRIFPLARWAAMLGFALWLFAGLVYLQDEFWFQLAVGAVPNMIFWTWYYINVGDVVRQHDNASVA